jgi:hypothetical protein
MTDTNASPTPPTDPPGSGPDPTSAPATPPGSQRPASDWREPAWFPPRDRTRRDRGPSTASIVFGLIVLGIGVYYFLDRTLGIAMPAIRWGSLWPVLLILLGGLILFRSVDRR